MNSDLQLLSTLRGNKERNDAIVQIVNHYNLTLDRDDEESLQAMWESLIMIRYSLANDQKTRVQWTKSMKTIIELLEFEGNF